MKLFVSYSRDDKSWVEKLSRAVRNDLHHAVWIDQQIVAATNWWETILENIEECDCVIYVMTPRSVESIYCCAEVDYGLALNKPILPLMLKSCEMPNEIADRHIQYEEISETTNMDRVLLKIQQGIHKLEAAIKDGKFKQEKCERPNIPQPEEPEHVFQVFTAAEEAAVEGNIHKAEELYKQVITVKPDGLGREAKRRLDQMHREQERDIAYAEVLRLAKNKRMQEGAKAAWKGFIEDYPDYDPDKIAKKLGFAANSQSTTPSQLSSIGESLRLTYRKEETEYVMERLIAGECVSLISTGDLGTSELLLHFTQSSVLTHYMGERSNNIYTVPIAPNMLTPISSHDSITFRIWVMCELLLHRLYLRTYPFDMLGDDAQGFFDTYQALQDGTNPLYAAMGSRYFEHSLQYFIRRNIRIVFMFNEFNRLFELIPPHFFDQLKGIHENTFNRVSFVTISNSPIPILAEQLDASDQKQFQPFMQLFRDSVYYIGPLSSIDINNLINRIKVKHPYMQPSDAALEFLKYATGGYNGLFQAGYRALEMMGNIDQKNNWGDVERMANRVNVRSECEVIWESLTPSEQLIIRTVAQRIPSEVNAEDETAITRLVQRRLLRVNRESSTLQIEPPIFNIFVTNMG